MESSKGSATRLRTKTTTIELPCVGDRAMFKVKAKHIPGTKLCSIELPCRYKDKELTIVVYE